MKEMRRPTRFVALLGATALAWAPVGESLARGGGGGRGGHGYSGHGHSSSGRGGHVHGARGYHGARIVGLVLAAGAAAALVRSRAQAPRSSSQERRFDVMGEPRDVDWERQDVDGRRIVAGFAARMDVAAERCSPKYQVDRTLVDKVLDEEGIERGSNYYKGVFEEEQRKFEGMAQLETCAAIYASQWASGTVNQPDQPEVWFMRRVQ